MADDISNPDDSAHALNPRREPDAHGQAAMLLVESLIHALVARAVIDVPQAIEIVEVAAEVKLEIADELAETARTMRESLALLEAISASLKLDLP